MMIPCTKPIHAALLAVLLLLFPLKNNGQFFQLSDQNRFQSLQETIAQYHVQHAQMIDSVDHRFKANLINNLDPHGKYFLQTDVDAIYQSLDQIQLSQWDETARVMDTAYARLKKRMFRAYNFLQSLSECDFTTHDSIQLQPYHQPVRVYQTEKAFEASWNKSLRYQSLMSSLGDSTRQSNPALFLKNLNSVWKTYVENSRCEIKTVVMENGRLKQTVFDAFLNAYAQCFDPHSNYFSIEAKEVFSTSLNTELFSPGFYVDPDFKDYYITEVIANSKASKITELHAGDKIVSVLVDSTYFNPSCLSEQKMYDLFYGQLDSTLTVKILCPKDRITRSYTFSKALTTNSYNKSLSFQIQSEDLTIGYVMLPSFYMMQGGQGDSAGQDLAAILMQLKSLNTDGLILDLRGNGGGSLAEAVDLASLFAAYGPLFLTKDNRSSKPTLIKDTKKGRLTEQKTIILVNQFSASAAELVAHALQTYPDILVAGAKTYGKSSGQDILPLFDGEEVFGYAKVTSLEISRFDGVTIQGKGATPDIVIPSGIPSGMGDESNQKFVLKFEQPNRNVAPLFKRREPLDALRMMSQQRLDQNAQLSRLLAIEQQFTVAFSKPLNLSLNYQNFSWPLENLPDITDTTGYYSVTALTQLPQDSAIQAYQVKLLEEDPIILEAVKIMEDWLTLIK